MSLKVFDLECATGHVFEGWFASHQDYDQQLARGLLTCPVCDNHSIVKRLSAPHLNVKHARSVAAASDAAADANRTAASRRHVADARTPNSHAPDARATDTRTANAHSRDDGSDGSPTLTHEASQVAKLQAALFHQIRQVVNSAENVGPRFAEEARRMHEGEGRSRAIRGTATPQEREALAEEGIEVMSVPDIFDDDRLQ